MVYIGYLIISTVQLGATVDYGILFTQHYVGNRGTRANTRRSRRRSANLRDAAHPGP